VSRAVELTSPSAIDVVVGIVLDSSRRVLVAQRPAGKPMAGLWEFPGGKLEPREEAFAGLRRELNEELGIDVQSAEPFFERRFDYPDWSVRLDVWWVSAYSRTVRSAEGQPLQWVTADDLTVLPILPADQPIVAAIRSRLADAANAGTDSETRRPG
jgi:8-oxo-dGTP diphosphatase